MSDKFINLKSSNSNTIQKITLVSTIVLSLLLMIYFCVTIFGLNSLNNQIKLIIEHPVVVSRHAGELLTKVALMRGQTQRLHSYNQQIDVDNVREALDEWYDQIQVPLDETVRLYLGPKDDIIVLRDTYQELRKRQLALLEYAVADNRTKEEITQFEEELLYPLYTIIEKNSNAILAFTHNTQIKVYKSADVLWKNILVWSIFIVSTTIFGLFWFQCTLKRMNKALYYKNQQFDTLSKTIDETFMIFDKDSDECEFVAESAARILGIDAEIIKKNRNIIYQYMDENFIAEIKEKLYNNDIISGQELAIKFNNPKTNEVRWLLGSFYRIEDNANKSKHIVTFSDQTEEISHHQALKDALSNAQNANNAKRDFLSRMSHEIRTPMNAIIGMTTIAAASIEDRTRVEDCLTKISYSSKHLLMLINDILDMSRIESNKMSLNNEPFDLYQFINSLVAIVYPQASIQGVIFTEKMTGFTDNTIYIGDALRLNQVLINLVSNAIKFTHHGGSVELEVKRFASKNSNKDRIRFTVTDTGIGMNEDAVGRIYDPFEQANTSVTQKYGGTGLGMSITKNLVSLMGGFIEVKSVLGEGTSCIVELFFEKSDVEIEVLDPEKLKQLHTLVVDDEQDMCEHTTLLLSKINIRSQWVLTGAEAIETVVNAIENDDPFDICFIDWRMPNMDGVETTRKIRERVGNDTPIIIISSYDWTDIEEEARLAGANAFISKPLFLSSIYNVLVNVTNGSFARKADEIVKADKILIGKNILIAEDNELNIEIAEELLKMNGATVECSLNGQEALEAFIKSAPGYFDAILMDIQMPIMNGYEATQQIRALKRPDARTIPIIATTANAFTEDISAALAVGMNAHVSKPIDMKNLCDVLIRITV